MTTITQARIKTLEKENEKLLAENAWLEEKLGDQGLNAAGWASIALLDGLRVFVNVNTNEVSYKVVTDKKCRNFNNYQYALNFLSEIEDGE